MISDYPMVFFLRLSRTKEPFHWAPACRVQEASDVVYFLFHPYITLVSPALDCFSSQPWFLLRLGPTFSHAVYDTAFDLAMVYPPSIPLPQVNLCF